jgi:hypothetical protein
MIITAIVAWVVLHIICYWAATLNEFIALDRNLYGDFATSILGIIGLIIMFISDILLICLISDINFKIQWCRK